MFKNYIKVALRNLRKNRSYAFINILGLAMGLMVSILVFLYVIDETSYEKHITDYQDIYRMGINASLMGQTMDAPVSCSPMAEALRTDFAEVITAGRFKPVGQEIMLKHEDNKIYVQSGARADSVFLQIMDYEFVHGDPKTALLEDNAMVMTEETARKFFGDENPIELKEAINRAMEQTLNHYKPRNKRTLLHNYLSEDQLIKLVRNIVLHFL